MHRAQTALPGAELLPPPRELFYAAVTAPSRKCPSYVQSSTERSASSEKLRPWSPRCACGVPPSVRPHRFGGLLPSAPDPDSQIPGVLFSPCSHLLATRTRPSGFTVARAGAPPDVFAR